MMTRGIDAGQIAAMLSQIRAAAQATQSPQADISINPAAGVNSLTQATQAPSFADALSQSLRQVSQREISAEQLGNQFAAGDPNVSLSQAMIALQKANISFQETVQVRDKLVSAYTTIMNMQV